MRAPLPLIAVLLILPSTHCAFGQASGAQSPKVETLYSKESLDELPKGRGGCYGIGKDTLQQLSTMKLDLPIKLQCASIAADAYFEHVFGVCGIVGKSHESPSAWSFPCYVGIGGSPAGSIKVDKKTGRITCGSNESFESIPAFLKHLTPRSSRTPPALSSALSQHFAISAPLIASVQAGPLSFIR